LLSRIPRSALSGTISNTFSVGLAASVVAEPPGSPAADGSLALPASGEAPEPGAAA
jgi:hypothetical protein